MTRLELERLIQWKLTNDEFRRWLDTGLLPDDSTVEDQLLPDYMERCYANCNYHN
jgi:hypothetical protein